MFRRFLLTAVLGGALSAGAMAADVYVRIAPPRPLAERRAPAPARGYVWTPGYQRWDGRAYVWTPGRWVMPPNHRVHWVPSRWVHRRHGWVFVPGHWR